ncbi:tRNA(fMet)-specific endonuclease VapC [Candidatus Bilamarchaeum dharawalense]|uniref:tRNA(fMet)-specific endonuclease VapC n=1 Tax=Candidatus Bilamarchaeum dharawalense TaxID=2885759 RepID=A0A5E4LKJ0_9ARCH|nr:tRNA(fMet)-specific endonuclease VapC [Candidatus Bilamarchaeum dharawalense]
MILLDSSFLIALFNENDPAHNRAIGEMKKFEIEEKKFIISEQSLAKTIDVLLTDAGQEKAKIFMDFAVENYRIQETDLEDIAAILQILQSQKNSINYSDATLIYLSKFFGCSIATYNENLLKELKGYNVLK